MTVFHSVVSKFSLSKILEGGSLAPEDIISSHSVHSEAECSLKCLEEEACIGYNYRPESKKHEINCQISHNTVQKEKESTRRRKWMFYQDTKTLPVSKSSKQQLYLRMIVNMCLIGYILS